MTLMTNGYSSVAENLLTELCGVLNFINVLTVFANWMDSEESLNPFKRSNL